MCPLRSVVALFSLLPSLAFAATAPRISVAGLRIVGNGLGANGSELHAFNENKSGTTIALAIVMPEGSGIVEVDDDASRIDALTDNKGHSLLSEGRFGPFPKVSDDHSAAMVEIEVHDRPSAGASSLSLQGSVAMTVANGTKNTRIPNVRLDAGRTMKVGTATISVKSVTPGDESTAVGFGLTRTMLHSISDVRFFDSKGAAIESHRTSSGSMNEVAEVEFDVKSKEKVVAVEFETWQNIHVVKVPFNLTAALALGGEAQAAAPATSATSAVPPQTRAAAPQPKNPPTMPGPNEGAASVDAVMTQLKKGVAAGKGNDILAVIYPDDRANFAVVIATVVAMSTLAHLDKPQEAEKAQKEVDALIARHKLNMPLSRPPAEIFKNSDVAAFVTDGMAYLKSHLPKNVDSASALPMPQGRPENVRIDGDSAVASLDGKDVTFARLSGKWFIRLTD